MRGRRPKPTALKILHGDRIDPDHVEPQPEAAIPTCPEHLDKAAKQEWDRLAQELHQLGLLTRLDMAVLAAYCQCWARWVAAERQLAETGHVCKSPSGYPIFSSYLSVSNDALRQLK